MSSSNPRPVGALKALILLPHLGPMGPCRFALDLSPELNRAGLPTELFAVRLGPAAEIPHGHRHDSVTIGLPPDKRIRYGLAVMGGRLWRAARRADVVVSGNEIGEGLVAAFLAGKLARRPIVVIAQNNLVAAFEAVGGWNARVARWIYPRVDAVVCVSAGLRPSVELVGVPRERVRVVPNGVHTERVRSLASEPPPDWLPEQPYVVGLGRLHPQKGFDLLIRAHARMLEAGFQHRLVVIGEGPDRDGLVALAAQLGVSASVLLPGFVSNPFPVLSRAALFCLPSRFEGWPLALTEALVLGLPAIAADCVSGPREILDGGRFGDLVPVDSLDDLAGAIARHLARPNLLAEKAMVAASEADRFSVQARAAEYVIVFNDVVSERRLPAVGPALPPERVSASR